MSRARHERKHRAAGGLTSKPVWNAGGEQNAAKEAEERKRGGRARHHAEGKEAKARHDRPKRERGGGVDAGSVVARAKGGHVSAHADYHPFGKKPGHSKVSHRGMHVDGTGGHVAHGRARGGAAGDDDADDRARGGRVKRARGGGIGETEHDKEERQERARGGRTGHLHGEHDHPDGHLKHRARGGRLRGEGVGAERTPLSGAAKIKEITPHEVAPHGVRSD